MRHAAVVASMRGVRCWRRRTAAAFGALAWALGPGAGGADSLDDEPEAPIEVAVAAVPLEIAGEQIAPGTVHRFALAASESFAGAPVAIPIAVLHGAWAGPTVCLTAGIHGDEINGVESVRRSIEPIDVAALRGTILAIPIVNLHGFRRGSRYLPDRRDLNRHFPGRERGSAASRIARTVFEQVVRRCDYLVDFHTGSFQRANLPHARADLSNPGVRALVEGLGGWRVVDHPGSGGTLRRAASDAGIPAVTLEVGGPYRVEPAAVARGLDAVAVLLAHVGLQGVPALDRPSFIRRSRWVRVDDGGLLFTHVNLGDAVADGDLLGVVIDPISNQRSEIRAPGSGQVLGMAFSQVVIPGFAAFHLALTGPADPLDDGAALDESHAAVDDIDGPEPDDRPE